MLLLDTNVFIYLANGTLNSGLFAGEHVVFASVTKVEALGYGKIRAREQDLLEQWFDEWEQFDLDEPTIAAAIKLRLQKSMGLSDAIVAATCLTSDIPLCTANTADFSHINRLRLVNPFQLAT